MIEQIGYLGLSVLWKSAAHSWKNRNGTMPSINLGSLYQEQVRQYLLKTGPFPEHGAMVVQASDENNRLIAVIGSPVSRRWPSHHLHWIDLCGVRFNLFIGARMPQQLKELCAFRRGQKCVVVAKQQEAMLVKTYREHLKVMAGKH